MSPITLTLLTILISVILVRLTTSINRYFAYRRLVNQTPGLPNSSFLWGDIRELFFNYLANRNGTLSEKLHPALDYAYNIFITNRDKHVFRFWIGPIFPVFIFNHPDSVEMLLASKSNLSKSFFFYEFNNPWSKQGLKFGNGETWFQERKTMNPILFMKNIEEYLQTFNQEVDGFLEKIENQPSPSLVTTGENSNQSIQIDDLSSLFEDFMLTLSKRAYFGIDRAHEESTDMQNIVYIESMTLFFRQTMERHLFALYWPDIIFNNIPAGEAFRKNVQVINEFCEKIIDKRLNCKQDSMDDSGGFMLDIMLDKCSKSEPPYLTKDYLIAAMNNFLVGTHSGLSTALTNVTWLLGHHPEIQRKAREEVEMVKKVKKSMGSDGEDDDWTISDIKSMKYLEWCCKESLRLLPSIIAVGRNLDQELVLKDGQTRIPANSECMIPIISIHRDPEFFPEPERFIPERFDGPLKHPYAYIPFLAGPRNCMGQKLAMFTMQWLLAKLLIRYRFKSLTKLDEISLEMGPRFQHIQKIQVLFEHI